MSKALEFVDEQLVIDLTKRLIKTPSVSGNENKLRTLLAIEMTKAGFTEVKYDENNNIVGKMPGQGTGKSLLLASYIDTVPPGTMEDAFTPKEIDGSKLGTKGKVITGRGAVDMKSSLAAMICVASAFKRTRSRLKGDFIVVGLANTKSGKNLGIKKLIDKFELAPDYIVVGAPTNLNINISHPGQAIFEVLAKGKMGNIGYQEASENAILKMNRIISCLNENINLPKDKLYGQAQMFFSSIISNPVDATHSIPDLCHSLLVRQYFENEDPEQIKLAIKTTLSKNNFKEGVDFLINLRRHFRPFKAPDDSEIIQHLSKAFELVTKKSTQIGFWKGAVNISEIFKVDTPIVGFGPGNEKFANTVNEHVPISQLVTAFKVYTVLAEKICVQLKAKA
ncbi:MAG: M20/M25/M40 family metallo-hydrolase [Candidatus Heimdallarchaeota archaeon]|nr:M20/M25/M40 family metallo-hydrolase [Candidatus Heimdallarchaeota archaeon]